MPNRSLFVAAGIAFAFAPIALGGCVSETGEGDQALTEDLGVTDDELSKEIGLDRMTAPKGLPSVWVQPDSKGWFGEKGMCGPTSTANLLRLYGIEVSPATCFNEGVKSVVGTLPKPMERYLDSKHPQLKCTFGHADGADSGAAAETFLRSQLKFGRPVNIMIGMGGTSSHWVTIVGATKVGSGWNYSVMTWGRYYSVKGSQLRENWSFGYGGKYPYVSCDATSKYKYVVSQ